MTGSPRFVAVTGGNRGIGYATSRELAARGAHVLMTSRDVSRGEESAASIRAEFPAAQVYVLGHDLDDRVQWTLRNFTCRPKGKHSRCRKV